MLTIFDNISIKEFPTLFNSDDQCLSFLASTKWKDGFVCRNCGHTNSCKGKTPYSKRCTKCKKEESATANTIFHHCRISLPDAFRLAHIVCKNPNITTSVLSETLELRQMTCWKFKKKVTECIDSRTDIDSKGKAELREVILGKKQINY